MLEEFYFKNASLTDLASGSGAPVPTPKLFGLDLGVVSDSGLSDAFAFTAFVGANLLQSGITKWCMMETILRKLGVQPGC